MKRSIFKTVGLVMVITLVARLMALVSNQIIVTRFGVNADVDIYNYAVNFQVYAINCLGTTLITVMIPMFAGFFGTGEKERAFKFANNVVSLSFILAGIMALIGILIAPFIVNFTGFADSQDTYGFAVAALRIMFPVLMFYTLTYTFQGILQSQNRFLVPASVSVASSSVIILYTLFLGKSFGIKGLLIATLIGLSSQALIQIPALYKTEYRFIPSFNLKDRDVVSALKLAPPILISSSTYQVNMFYNMSTATYFDAATIVNMAQQLVLVAILSLAISMTSVMFPRLTTLAATNDMPEFKNTFLKILKTMTFLLLPMTLGLAAVSKEVINFIYGYGEFTAENVSMTALILALYSIGGVGLGIKEVTDKAFYSLKDTKKPAVIGVVMMIANVGISLMLVKLTSLNALAIPIAYSSAALIGSVTSIYLVWRKIGSFGGTEFIKGSLKVLAASVAMVAVVIPLTRLLGNFDLQFGLNGTIGLAAANAIKLFIPVGAGAVIFIVCTWLLKVEEAVDIFKKVKFKLLHR